MKQLTWEDCKEELEKVVNTRNDEYSESFRKARMTEAQFRVKEFLASKPDATKEEIEAYVKDYVDQAPDEFMRGLRIYCHTAGALFNAINGLIGEFNDFKELYMAVNEKHIKAYAIRHREEIVAQQKAMAEQSAPKDEDKEGAVETIKSTEDDKK